MSHKAWDLPGLGGGVSGPKARKSEKGLEKVLGPSRPKSLKKVSGRVRKVSEQLPCRSAEVKFFSVFLCQRCREIWREIFRAAFSRVWVCDGKFHQNFTSNVGVKNGKFHANFTLPGRSAEKSRKKKTVFGLFETFRTLPETFFRLLGREGPRTIRDFFQTFGLSGPETPPPRPGRSQHKASNPRKKKSKPKVAQKQVSGGSLKIGQKVGPEVGLPVEEKMKTCFRTYFLTYF